MMSSIRFLDKNSIPEIEITNIDPYNLSRELNIKPDILKIRKNWSKVENKWFYFKSPNNEKFLLNELIGEWLSNFFNISSIHYRLAKIKKNNYYSNISDEMFSYGIMSENFCSGMYPCLYLGDLKIKQQSSDIGILDCIKEKISLSDSLINDIITMTVIDIYMGQRDRNTSNFSFFYDRENKLNLSPLYDFESSFIGELTHYKNGLFKLDLLDDRVRDYVKNDDLFQEKLYKLLEVEMRKILHEISKEYQIDISLPIIHEYERYDERIKKLILLDYQCFR